MSVAINANVNEIQSLARPHVTGGRSFATPEEESDVEHIEDVSEPVDTKSLATADPVKIVSLFHRKTKVVIDMMLGELRRFFKLANKDKRLGVSLEVVLDVCERMLLYCRDHSNRIWPSYLTIATKTGHGRTQVKLAITYLKTLFVCVLRRDELTLGPGPHRFPYQLRRNEKKLLTDCFDMGGAIKLLPTGVRRILAEILRSATEQVAEKGPVQEKKGLAGVQPAPSWQDDPRFDSPFEDKKRFVPGKAPDTSRFLSKNYTTRVEKHDNIKPSYKNPSLHCNVVDIEKIEVKRGGENPPSASPPAVSGRNSGSIYKVGASGSKKATSSKAAPVTPRRAPLEGEAKAADSALSAICDMGKIQRRNIIDSMGVEYVKKLVWYGRWRRLVGDSKGDTIVNLAGYLRKTWAEHYNKGRVVWENGDMFYDWVKKEKRIEEEAARIHADAARARVAVEQEDSAPLPPVDIAETPQNPLPALFALPDEAEPEPVPNRSQRFDPMALPEKVRDNLLRRAEEKMDTDPIYQGAAMKSTRDRARKAGWHSKLLHALATQIWRKSVKEDNGVET